MMPSAALDWLAGPEPAPILVVGATGGYAGLLARAGHTVTVVDADPSALQGLADQGLHAAAAKAEALPFDPCYFSAVVAIQNFHTLAPGLALSEWARVLAPGGKIGLAYLTRDDSVPWVRKLRRIVQAHLVDAMTSDYGTGSISALTGSAYFPKVESASFRVWVPSTRQQLQDSASTAAGADALEPSELALMLNEIGELYDEYARVPEPMLLPYQVQCWRAEVDHSSMTTALIPGHDGLSISL